MTLYRHFASKDELVAEYLRERARLADAAWDRLAAAHPGDALAQLRAWLAKMAERLAHADERGCALVNAAVELPEKSHPARRVIEEFKTAERTRLSKELETAEAEIVRRTARLGAAGFVDKAPAAVVQRERDGLATARATAERLRNRLGQLA